MENGNIILCKCGLANVFILLGNKVVIVDTGLRGYTNKVLNTLAKNGINRSDVSLILLTHAHPDHCLNTKHLQETLNVPVAISATDAEYIKQGEFAPVIPQNMQGKLLRWLLQSVHEKHGDVIVPDIVFDNELDLSKFGVKAKAILTPGHTLGASAVVFNNNQSIIVGDLIMESPILKKPMLPPFAMDNDMMISSAKKVLNGNYSRIYTSHGTMWETKTIKSKMLSRL